MQAKTNNGEERSGIKAIFREVIAGKMEWAYHESDGEYKMAAYAKAALETTAQDFL